MPRILVVEDDEIISLMMHSMLSRSGFEVVQAENGAHALGILIKDSQFDAVITDVFMPLVNGIQLTREVKRRYPSMPIIVVSAYPAKAKEALTHGANRYLPKPFVTSHLVDALDKVIGRLP